MDPFPEESLSDILKHHGLAPYLAHQASRGRPMAILAHSNESGSACTFRAMKDFLDWKPKGREKDTGLYKVAAAEHSILTLSQRL